MRRAVHASFAHQDWVDGEDVGQAEQTTGEDGFNTRFHRIESDLDALGSDFAQGPIPKRAFVERFGDEVLSDGEGLRDAMEIIPDDTLCQSPLSVLEGLATREGAAIRTSGLERESIEVTFALAGDARWPTRRSIASRSFLATRARHWSARGSQRSASS